MESLGAYQNGANSRFSAKKNTKPINFMFLAPQAKSVAVAGDFNNWDAAAHPLTRAVDGGWHGQIPLSHGHHRYLFIVDGQPALDPRAQGTVRNERNEKVSMISIS